MRALKTFLLCTVLFLAPFSGAGFAAPKAPAPDEEAQAFKNELIAVVKELEGGSEAGFLKVLDKIGTVKEAADGIASDEAGFLAAAAEGAAEIGRDFVRKTNRCGRSKIVRMRRDGESVFALVRLDYGDAGWGWVDMELAPGLDGSMRIVDVINHSTGLNLVETVRLYAVPSLDEEESKARLYGFRPGSEEAAGVSDLLADIRGGEYADGVQDYYDLEAALKKRKDVAFLGVRAAVLAGNPISYMKIMKGLAEERATDPSLQLLLAEYHFMADEPAKALARLEEFERVAGVRDAALLSAKASAACQMQRPDLGLGFAREAVELEPGLSDGHWASLLCHVVTRRFDQATAVARVLEEKFDYRMDEELLAKSGFYADLLSSREYQKWRESLEEE